MHLSGLCALQRLLNPWSSLVYRLEIMGLELLKPSMSRHRMPFGYLRIIITIVPKFMALRAILETKRRKMTVGHFTKRLKRSWRDCALLYCLSALTVLNKVKTLGTESVHWGGVVFEGSLERRA